MAAAAGLGVVVKGMVEDVRGAEGGSHRYPEDHGGINN